jgi:hypothetical protein
MQRARIRKAQLKRVSQTDGLKQPPCRLILTQALDANSVKRLTLGADEFMHPMGYSCSLSSMNFTCHMR